MNNAYDYIISLGLNCEVRYQLGKNYGAFDSSLLEWAVSSPESLARIIENPSLVFSGKIEEMRDYNMWRCKVTNTVFHGKSTVGELLRPDGKVDEEKIALEKRDTISRIRHLSDKFTSVARSLDSKLYIVGIHPEFCKYSGSELRAFVKLISSTISRSCNNSSLLVVTIKENLDSIKNLGNETSLFIRAIDHFSPFNRATNPQYADLNGWKKNIAKL